MTTTEIFILPVPSTSFLKSPKFREEAGRIDEITCEYEGAESHETIRLSLSFKDRYGVRITNGFASDLELIRAAYDRVVDLGETEWLLKIRSNLAASLGLETDLHHFAIYFDDGPLYEFICESFRASVDTRHE